MAREAVKEIPTFDPWAPYQIRSHNKKYTGDANGVHFVDGFGILYALPDDEDEQLRHESGECSCAEVLASANKEVAAIHPDECQERIAQLMWFYNANPLLKKVPVDPDEPEGEQEWRTYTAYLIEPYDPTARRKAKRNQSITVRELVPAANSGESVPAGGPIKVKGGA